MKKLLALILVLTLVLGMGVGVYAEEEYEDNPTVPITKNLTSQGANPAETFNFTVGAGTGVRDGESIPAPGFGQHSTFDITIGEDGLSKSHNLVLPNFTQVGVYTYPIYEAEGTTAGMVYDKGPKDLVITVINNVNHDPDDEDSPKFLRVVTITDYDNNEEPIKVDAFENEFYSGDLVITKEITGNYALYDDEFDVTVTLTPPADKVIKEGPIAVSGAVNDEGSVAAPDSDGKVVVTFKVTHESEVTIANIPYGVSYEVSEDSGSYEQEILGKQGTISAATQTVGITNTLNTEINMGVNLDNLPYILILGAASVGLVAFTLKRRFSDDR